LFINGSSGESISAFDRGLQYGDGLFETIAVAGMRPCLWKRHYQRLQTGGERLGIPIPEPATLFNEIEHEIGSNRKGVIKVIVTRGEGNRGYRVDQNAATTRIVHFSPWPNYPDTAWISGVAVRVCTTRLGYNPILAGIKHLNRLEQVMARREWDDIGISEGLMLDADRHVIEGTMTNIFMFKNGMVHTPDLSACGVAGVMRGLVLDVAEELGIEVNIRQITLPELLQADSLFLTNSLIGTWPICEIDGKKFTLDYINQNLISEVTNRAYV
jgi:4-amino-4-deoxychorismate lyase